ncbi:next to BRCA1 gene 1 protein isoform X2 [Bufo gargarizans]|uniref:next to BRCA1 gene 1 protein isoform X2 n=1 Tax=Bufo gargarizans TaxID=30331 RepID=UPI001CF10C42|nr:next to BRCA1 gene 1 protein isoform X2 [Bufo gargarizans]
MRLENMEPQVNLCVSCRGETQSFLVSDSEKTTWADVEAMVQVSFDLNDIQLKYIDEDNEEVSVNSQGEYEEALKIAVNQGGILRMNVYEQQPSQTVRNHQLSERSECGIIREAEMPVLYKSLVARSAASERQTEELSTGATEELCQNDGGGNIQAAWFINYLQTEQHSPTTDISCQAPPVWFTSYMDRFKEQIIHETVEKVTQIMRDRFSQSQDWMSDSSSSSAPIQEPERETSLGSLYDWLLACSNCKKRILGIRYQCSTCPSFGICELCEAEGCDHDPNHLFLKMRRPVEPCSEARHPSPPFSVEQVRFQKQMHKTFLKAEKQRLRAEKRQRKAEVKELEKQLKLHRRIHRWHSLDSSQPPTDSTHSSPLVIPIEPCSQFIPTFSAVFVDENLPDGTHLQPGTKFIKHWRMKNTGNVKWNLDTKLKFMWGNLTLSSSSRKEAPVPSLLPGQMGVLSVEFVAPALEGTYTSHWRLAHKGEQFGPRIWCSIIVDSLPCTENLEDVEKEMSSIKISSQMDKEEEGCSAHVTQQVGGGTDKEMLSSHLRSAHSDQEVYIPSVDLLTAQDLLSFELLDINIVQELERVPHNTPVDMTPCMSPLPHDGPLIEKPGLGQIKEESDGAGCKIRAGKRANEDMEGPSTQEEAEEDISGTQFVCETVMRSLTLDAAPDYNPPQKKSSLHSSVQSSPQSSFNYSVKSDEDVTQKSSRSRSRPVVLETTDTNAPKTPDRDITAMVDAPPVDLYDIEPQIPDEHQRDEVESQASSDSSEDYIIILPECFDTSRPLGESMYSSALSESQGDKEKDTRVNDETYEGGCPVHTHSINDILTTSQTLDAVPLTPEVITPSPQLRSPPENEVIPEVTEEMMSSGIGAAVAEQAATASTEITASPQPSEASPPPRSVFDHTRQHSRGSIAGGLVKGALSVAASAYKALFVGQQETAMPQCSEEQAGAMMAVLLEMGFCDRQLNQRLLRKHNYNLMDVVTELIQINDNDWYSARY